MAISEFRYNKKRKHYSYIYGQKGDLRKNLLFTSKSVRRVTTHGKTRIIKNHRLYKNPNPNKTDVQYVMNKRCLDHKDSFANLKSNWSFDKKDKRTIKRLKKGNK